MNPGLVLAMLGAMVAAIVIAVTAATWSSVRSPWRVACPRDGRDAHVQVDGHAAVRAEFFGGEPRIGRCSLWPVLGCGEECLATPVAARRPAWSGELLPATPECRTILVPLDGTPQSEAVLPVAAALARGHGGRMRLLRVMPRVGAVHNDGRVVVYLDQEVASADSAARDYLRGVKATLRDFEVDTVVRFGDPATEILSEARAHDVALIAMGSRRRAWLRPSVTARVARKAWVPVVRAAYGAVAS